MAANLRTINATLSADGSTTVITWRGGMGTYAAYGTWGGGTLKLEASFDNGSTYISLGTDGELTADGAANFEVPGGVYLRATLSSSTSPSLKVEIRPHASA